MSAQAKHDQALPEPDGYNLLDADNIYYVEAKRLLVEGKIDQFEYFITSIATTDDPFSLYDFLKRIDNDVNLKSLFYRKTDCCGDIATDVLELYMETIMHRLKIKDLDSLALDY